MIISRPTKQALLQFLVTELRRNPYPVYRTLRRFSPVTRVPKLDFWLVSRFDDVKRVLTDYGSFSSNFVGVVGAARGRSAGSASQSQSVGLITSDPPEHTKLRGLVTKAFTPRAVARLEPRIAALTHELIDRVAPSGTIDLIQDLAYPLPVIVIAEMLGIPAEDRAKFKRWSDAIVVSADSAVFDRQAMARPPGGAARYGRASLAAHAQLAENGVSANDLPPWLLGDMAQYFRTIIAQRRADPSDDLISGLIRAEVDGERLTEHEVLSFCWLLLVAGNVTTTNLIGNAITALLDHPAQFARLRSDSSLLPTTIEEVLRYRSPVQFMFRASAKEVQLGGRTIPEGQMVLALIGAANRDERQFPGSETFDITRDPTAHLGFGHGVHYCLGAPLARLEARVALPIIFDRLPNMARFGPRRLDPTAGIILHGVRSLPLRFQPSPSVHPFDPTRTAA